MPISRRNQIHRSSMMARDDVGMDVVALVSALIGAQTGMMQLALAARLTRMDNADTGASIAKLVEAADQNANSLANVAAGVGTNLDINA